MTRFGYATATNTKMGNQRVTGGKTDSVEEAKAAFKRRYQEVKGRP